MSNKFGQAFAAIAVIIAFVIPWLWGVVNIWMRILD